MIASSKKELDEIYIGPCAVKNLQAQIRFRSLVKGEGLTLKGSKDELYDKLLKHIISLE